MSEENPLRPIRRAFAVSIALHALVGAWFLHRILTAPVTLPEVPLAVDLKPEPHPVQLPPKVPPVPQALPEKTPPPQRPQTPPPRPPQPQLTRPAEANAPAPAFSVPAAVEPAPTVPVAPVVAPAPAVAPRAVSASAPSFDAAYLNNPKPEYPAAVRRRRQQGTSQLEVRVGADGRPLAVEISRSSGVPELDEAAIRAVRGWTFVPAKRGSEAVEGSVEVPIRFRLDN